jgi:hypothetical protein
MTRAEVLAELREVVNDKRKPYAWSDTRMMRALSLGQDQFCKDTGFFRDTRNFNIAALPDVAAYAIPARVIEVRKVFLGAAELARFEGVAPNTAVAGPPYAWQVDQDSGEIVLYPTPDQAYTLNLHVWRKSRVAFSTAGEMEIPEDFHLAPVEYAAWLFYSDHDRELQDPVKAAEHKDKFDKYWVPEGKRAMRRLCTGPATFGPNPLYNV